FSLKTLPSSHPTAPQPPPSAPRPSHPPVLEPPSGQWDGEVSQQVRGHAGLPEKKADSGAMPSFAVSMGAATRSGCCMRCCWRRRDMELYHWIWAPIHATSPCYCSAPSSSSSVGSIRGRRRRILELSITRLSPPTPTPSPHPPSRPRRLDSRVAVADLRAIRRPRPPHPPTYGDDSSAMTSSGGRQNGAPRGCGPLPPRGRGHPPTLLRPARPAPR
ncbi:unnamed protein product, partial [Urochloa humidicola]